MMTYPLITSLTPHLAARYAYLKARIETLSPYPDKVQCMAVTKYLAPEALPMLWEAGMLLWGENRVQDACHKWEVLASQLSEKASSQVTHSKIGAEYPFQGRWELIGTLQKNKINKLLHAPWQVSRIQSVDSLVLAQALHERLRVLDTRTVPLPILCQVNITQEVTKHGFTSSEILRDWETLCHYDTLQIEGLMTMLPVESSPKEQAKGFEALRTLQETLQTMTPYPLTTLSMGMSQDWELALAQGATCIRMGRWLYRPEPPPAL